jgi:hypothetical protein
MDKGEVIPSFKGKGSKKIEDGPVIVLRQIGPLGASDEILPFDDANVWEALLSAVLRIDTCVYTPDGHNI